MEHSAPDHPQNLVACQVVERKLSVPIGADLDRLLREAVANDGGTSEAQYVREAIVAKITRGQVADELDEIRRRLDALENDKSPGSP